LQPSTALSLTNSSSPSTRPWAPAIFSRCCSIRRHYWPNYVTPWLIGAVLIPVACYILHISINIRAHHLHICTKRGDVKKKTERVQLHAVPVGFRNRIPAWLPCFSISSFPHCFLRSLNSRMPKQEDRSEASESKKNGFIGDRRFSHWDACRTRSGFRCLLMRLYTAIWYIFVPPSM
jgi:hypothetical protein